MRHISSFNKLIPDELSGLTKLIIVMVIISVWLECLGISLLIPLFELMLNGSANQSTSLQIIKNVFNLENDINSLSDILILLALVYSLKIAF